MRLIPLALLALACDPDKDVQVHDSDPVVADEQDLDGDGVTEDQGDCDDSDAAVYPGAVELCNGVDDDCDGAVDNDPFEGTTYYTDADGDGYGDDATAVSACAPEDDQVDAAGDCDDSDAAFNPGAPEDDCADPNDYNCDGSVGYADADGDGFAACEECDDTDAAVHPDATELCNGVDDDCDGEVDVGAVDAETVWQDVDGDGYGDADFSAQSCAVETGYADNPDDCDDAAPSVNPGATELCNEVDDDCDGEADEDASDAPTWYIDYDGDGYGATAYTAEACDQPNGYVDNADDCDDTEGEAYPGGVEVCDGVDNDCDGSVDDGASGMSTWYADSDGDGYGDASSPTTACDQPNNTVSDSTDCDDSEADAYPGNAEVCDGVDNDCDGTADDGNFGLSALCAAESCAEVLADNSANADGDYYLDPEGDGSAALYSCDMTTDGGGWTLVLRWDRQNDGDTQADFEALLTENTNNMSDWSQSTSYIQWSDYNSTADVMDYEHPVEVPNGGEALLDPYVYAYSHEDSAVFFSGETSAGWEEIWCRAYWGWNTTFLNAWASAEQAYHPYTCSDRYNGQTASWTLNTAQQASLSAEITSFRLTSFHYDGSYGDYTRLYYMDLWVR